MVNVSKELFEERYAMMENIAKEIVWRTQGRVKLHEAINEFWIAIAEADNKKGEPIDMALANKICVDKRSRLFRNDIVKGKKVGLTCDESVKTENGSSTKGDTNADDYIFEEVVQGNMMISQFLSKYPEGSKERMFVEFYMSKAGLSNKYTFDMNKNKSSLGGYTGTNLAKILGFKGVDDGQYRALKKKMMKDIEKFFCLKGVTC